VYALDDVCDRQAPNFDLTWRARYMYPTVPTISVPTDAVQYWNSHSEFGADVDRSVCGDAWEDVMTDAQFNSLCHERSWCQYVLALGRPPENTQVYEARAARIAQIGFVESLWEMTGSAEGAASGGIVGRVVRLEARVAALEAGGHADPAALQKITDELNALHAALAAASTATAS
jgi:hypothetical protein